MGRNGCRFLVCLLAGALVLPLDGAKAEDGNRGWYAGLAGGFVLPKDSDYRKKDKLVELNTEIGMKSGLGILGTLGYGLGNGLRAEVEMAYRRFDTDELNGAAFKVLGLSFVQPGAFEVDGKVASLSLMVNGLYDFEIWTVRPYFGGGIGLARQEWQADDLNFQRLGGNATEVAPASETDFVFGYQAMLGIGYPLSEKADIHLGYRYFATNDFESGGIMATYATHNFEAGIRYRF